MFGEDEAGESPPVPSPWDSLISISGSPATTPSPPTPCSIPRLVPEAEEGNVEYKLQLLNPSPARFTRLVTQMKWRLLEGGGQAYYELGVADSGALVGLPRQQLEESLETLECMAGDIGASVIVVKEIEVPKEIAGIAAEETDGWNRKRSKDKDRHRILPPPPDEGTTTTTTEAESPALFALDPLDTDEIPVTNLEISAVFKPRPFRTRIPPATASISASEKKRNTRERKREKLHILSPDPEAQKRKRQSRREQRDRRRDERQKALLAYAVQGVAGHNKQKEDEEELVHKLETLHVDVQPAVSKPPTPPPPDDEEDDVFPAISPSREHAEDNGRRLIVEALVVRKLSLDEAFLDFGGAFEAL